ncbi:MAG: hypothetical protein AAFV87_16380 [Pseudomonadota bacterium]
MRIAPTLVLVVCLGFPLQAQEDDGNGLSLMERGAELFLDGLLQQMEPGIQELQELAEDFGPAMRSFVTEMGPALRELMEEVKDWSVYEAPEILENGDIIIRRKQPKAEPPLDGQIDI